MSHSCPNLVSTSFLYNPYIPFFNYQGMTNYIENTKITKIYQYKLKKSPITNEKTKATRSELPKRATRSELPEVSYPMLDHCLLQLSNKLDHYIPSAVQ